MAEALEVQFENMPKHMVTGSWQESKEMGEKVMLFRFSWSLLGMWM